MAWPVNTG